LTEGITWQWESFPQYLDAIEKRHLAVDFGTQVAHGAVRGYAMGERGARNEDATDDDIAGEPVPGTYAAERELFGLGRAMAAGGQAVFELAPAGAVGEDDAAAMR